MADMAPVNVTSPYADVQVNVKQLSAEQRLHNQHGAHAGTSLEWWYLTGHFWKDALAENIASDKSTAKTANKSATKSTCSSPFGFPTDAKKNNPDFGMQSTFFYSGQGKSQGLLAQVAESDFVLKKHKTQQRAEPYIAGVMQSLVSRITPLDLNLQLANWKLTQLNLTSPLKWHLTQTIGDSLWELSLEPDARGLWLHGDNGYLRKVDGKGNFYSSFPFVKATGVRTLLSTGERIPVCGSVWFDHEIHVQAVDKVGWNWFAVRMPDGKAYMIYQILSATGQTKIAGEFFDSINGLSSNLKNIKIEPGESICLKSKNCYVQKFNIRFSDPKNAGHEVKFEIKSMMPEQEMTGLAALKKEYWEGGAWAVRTHSGKLTKPQSESDQGLAYIEMVPLPK